MQSCSILIVKNINELTEHWQIEFSQPLQPLGQSRLQGQPKYHLKSRTGNFLTEINSSWITYSPDRELQRENIDIRNQNQ